MRFLKILAMAILVIGCKKDPEPPRAVSLVSPAKNAECNPIQSLAGNKSVVEFSWQAGANSSSYELRVTNLNTNETQTATSSGLSETLTLDNAAPFSWSVVSKNNDVAETATSETWFFFNPGSLTSFAPFPAEIVQPLPGSQVFKDSNDEVLLEWEGADLDNDIQEYVVYFGAENPPAVLISEPSSIPTSKKVSVSSNTTYYWRVVTTDREGNASDTQVISFKVL